MVFNLSDPIVKPRFRDAPRVEGATRQPRVAIIGAGFSGMGLAIRLKHVGLTNFVIFEKSDNVGGTWRDNKYPGLSCDIPSQYYSYSFAPNPNWSKVFSPGSEIQRYIEKVADAEGIREWIEYDTSVTDMRYKDGQWFLSAGDKDLGVFDFVVTAVGFLHHAKDPDIPGLDSFQGDVLQTAKWDHKTSWAGKRVGVIGNGSSGTQVVGAITNDAQELVHFVRTPQWIWPLDKDPYSAVDKLAQRFVPGKADRTFKFWEVAQDAWGEQFTEPGEVQETMKQQARDFLESAVTDPELRAQLTPDYPPGCRRPVISSEYYPAIQQPHARLVRDGIDQVVPQGIRTADGTVHELDLIVVATGYDTHAFMRRINVVGESGQTIDDEWRDGYRTYESVALDGFPNFFMIGGPHSPFGHFSYVLSGEHQGRYITRWIEAWARGEHDVAAPTRDAVDDFTRRQREKMKETSWGGACVSWYQDPTGTPSLYPWSAKVFRESMSRRVVDDFVRS